WLPAASDPVTVRGYQLTGGLLYVGGPLPAAYHPGPEPAVVDPDLPVRRVRLDQESPPGDDVPAYGALTAGARAAYLEWLADGRSGPTPRAHLWLFLAGVERRVLHDLAGRPEGLADYLSIGAELRRLRTAYGHVAAFDAHAAAFAATVDALTALADPHLRPPTDPERLTPQLAAGLGRYLAAGQPLPGPWAYAWAAATGHAAPGAHGRDEFLRRFAGTHPDGLHLRPPAHPLVLTYHPANPGFAGRTVTLRTPVPDVRFCDFPSAPSRPSAAGTTPPTGSPRPDTAARTGPLRARTAAVAVLLRLLVLAGADDELLAIVRGHLCDLHHLPPAERDALTAAVARFAATAPPLAEVRARYTTLDDREQEALARLLIATASADGVVEPEHAQLLAAAYDVLGPGEADLCRRLRALEVAAVVTDSARADATATVLDEAMVAETLRDPGPQLALLEDLLTA
ncbi:MAG TPA: TerB N-terminal domain-containing protein, partial [Pilimelia sp.]|nr:TerB N-terminal domain-containing protein [Pilimelia sp.]